VDLGSEFYRFKRKLPERYIGKTFTDVSKELIDKKMIKGEYFKLIIKELMWSLNVV